MEMVDLMFAHTMRFCKAPLMQFYLGNWCYNLMKRAIACLIGAVYVGEIGRL